MGSCTSGLDLQDLISSLCQAVEDQLCRLWETFVCMDLAGALDLICCDPKLEIGHDQNIPRMLLKILTMVWKKLVMLVCEYLAEGP